MTIVATFAIELTMEVASAPTQAWTCDTNVWTAEVTWDDAPIFARSSSSWSTPAWAF